MTQPQKPSTIINQLPVLTMSRELAVVDALDSLHARLTKLESAKPQAPADEWPKWFRNSDCVIRLASATSGDFYWSSGKVEPVEQCTIKQIDRYWTRITHAEALALIQAIAERWPGEKPVSSTAGGFNWDRIARPITYDSDPTPPPDNREPGIYKSRDSRRVTVVPPPDADGAEKQEHLVSGLSPAKSDADGVEARVDAILAKSRKGICACGNTINEGLLRIAIAEELSASEARIAELESHIRFNRNNTFCVHCKETVPNVDGKPDISHTLKCPAHPMRALEAKLARYTKALRALRGDIYADAGGNNIVTLIEVLEEAKLSAVKAAGGGRA